MRMIPSGLIERASAVRVEDEADRRGLKLRKIAPSERAGPCPKCGGRDRFSINVRKQVFFCRGSGGGDVIAMVQHMDGRSFREAVEFLTGERTAEAKPRANQAPTPVPEPEDVAEARHERDLASARRIVAGVVPVAGTAGEAYLRDVRKINVATLRDVLETVDSIGWNPSVYFAQSNHEEPFHELDGQRLGAIIGIMTDPITARPTGGISRTYLHEGQKVMKAKSLGPGGIVRLSADEEVLGGLHLGEGLETCLYAMAKGARPMWSAGSTSPMRSFPVLGGIEHLTIIADHDENGAGENAAAAAAERWRAAGRTVRVVRPKEIGDVNDIGMRPRP
jgi:Toprim domain